jgi:hypothetical protein
LARDNFNTFFFYCFISSLFLSLFYVVFHVTKLTMRNKVTSEIMLSYLLKNKNHNIRKIFLDDTKNQLKISCPITKNHL